MAGRSAILAIHIVGKDKGAGRQMDRTAKDMDKLGKSAAKSGVELSRMYDHLDAASSAILKVQAATTVAMSAVSHLAGIGRSLGPMVGVVAAVPGVLGIAGAATATLMVATNGLGTALAAAGGDAKKYQEAIKGMPPEMQAAVGAMAGIKAGFSSVQNSVQTSFWTGLAAPITALGKTALPVLNSGMTRTATASSRMAAGLIKGATSATKAGALTTIFAGAERVMSSLAPAIAPAVDGILRLVAASSKLIPGFDGAGAAAQRFNAWVTRVSSDGTLAGWFNRGMAVAGQFGSVLSSAGKIILGVLNAASKAGGGSSITSLSVGMAQLAKVVNDPAIQTKMTDAFTRANTAMAAVMRVIVAISPALAGMLPYLTMAAAGWKVFSAGATGAKVIGSLVPIFGKLGTGAAGAARQVGMFASGFRSSQAAASAFSGTAGTMGGAVRSLVTAAGQAAAAAARTVAAWVAAAARTVAAWAATGARIAAQFVMASARAVASAAIATASWVASAATSAAAWAANMARVMAGYAMIGLRALATGAQMAAAWLIGLGPIGWAIAAIIAVGAAFAILWTKCDWFRNAMIGLWRGIVAVAQAAWSGIVAAAQAAWSLIVAYVTTYVSLIVAIVRGIVAVAAGVWSAISGAASAAWAAISAAASAAVGAISGILSRLAGIAAGVWSAISGAASAAWAAISAAASAAVGAISSGLSSLGGVASRVAGAISGAFSGAWGAITGGASAMAATVSGILGRITAAISKAKSAVASVAGKIGFGQYTPTAAVAPVMAAATTSLGSLPTVTATEGTTIVRREVNITIQGAIDPHSTARQIRAILAREDSAQGRRVAY